MSTLACLAAMVAMFPVFGLALWLRFANDPNDAEMCALVSSQGWGFAPRVAARELAREPARSTTRKPGGFAYFLSPRYCT